MLQCRLKNGSSFPPIDCSASLSLYTWSSTAAAAKISMPSPHVLKGLFHHVCCTHNVPSLPHFNTAHAARVDLINMLHCTQHTITAHTIPSLPNSPHQHLQHVLTAVKASKVMRMTVEVDPMTWTP